MPQLKEGHLSTAAPRQPLLNCYEIGLLVADLVEVQGIPEEQLLAGSGVSPRQLQNPGHLLTLQQELLLYTRVAHLNRDPLLGFRIGQQLSLPNYGALGHAMMGAVSINEVLQLIVEFTPLVTWSSHGELSAARYHGVACKRFTLFPAAPDMQTAALEIETTFASVQEIFNFLAGVPLRFAGIEMTHNSKPRQAEAYRELFGCAVAFGAPRNALYIPHTLLSYRLPNPQPENRELFRDMCSAEMEALVEGRGLIAVIRALLQGSEAAVPSLEQIAAHFSLSSRTLRRHLQSLGVSYRGLLDDSRYTQAQRLLERHDLSVENIARRLGYADARSFRTAFRRWSGMTPSQFRQQRVGTG